MKKHVQTDSEWQEEMSQKIIDEIQCELYLDMPFMKLALSALSPKVNEQLNWIYASLLLVHRLLYFYF